MEREGLGSLTVPALALAPVLIEPGTGASTRTLNQELLDRAARPDYHTWLAGTAATGGCTRPIRLRGTVRDVDPATGEVIHALDTDQLPDRVLYTPCGDRRASVCPACAETYRRDTYQLIRAGLTGGKGIPPTVAAHPCVFATFTAPSFGPVHTRRPGSGGRPARCHPRRKAEICPHGRRLSCGQRHTPADITLGRPLCGDCYDYAAAVVWNAHAPELWRRTTIAIRRHLARTAKAVRAGKVQLSYAKVAEFQGRGLVHFHAIFRLDATSPDGQLAPPGLDAAELTAAITAAAASVWFATVAHPARPGGWDIRWGAQLDTRTIRLPIASGGQASNIAVASYLAKYATKSTESVGTVSARITAANVGFYGNPRSHQGRLIRAAWHLGSHHHPDFAALRRWAHMLGYRGHFATKSRRYSTTLRAIRAARADHRRRQHPRPLTGHHGQALITITHLQWAGSGWRTTGDALLALSAAARAREHDQAARDVA
jgi:hypothetical protein